MPAYLQLALAIAIIILSAKSAGYVSTRLGQPAVLGELLAGLILGPTALNLVHWPIFTDTHLGESIAHLAELGVVFLMFIAGLEVHLEQLKRLGKVAAFAGTLGVVTPILLGWGTAAAFRFELQAALFVGLILSATSVSISAQTLLELKVLRSRVGMALLGAAVFDDVLVILFLSLFVALTLGVGNTGISSMAWVVVRMGLYLVGASLVGAYLIPRLARRVVDLPISQGLLAAVVITLLLFAWAAEIWGGMAAITGAFMAGLFFARTDFKESIEEGMHHLAYAFFVPIFFVNVGLDVNARQINLENGLFVIVLTLAAIISKILGSGIGARLGGFSNREALQLGIGMVSRGEVGLIVASVGLAQELISSEVFAAIVIMVILTTLLTPLMLRMAFKPPAPEKATLVAEVAEAVAILEETPSEGEDS